MRRLLLLIGSLAAVAMCFWCDAVALAQGTAGERRIALPGTVPITPDHERRVALVIGNGNYGHLPVLANPKLDAEGMAAALRHAGFALVGDGALIDLDLRALQQAIRRFSIELQSGAVGMFYYSGHGLELGGRNYLVPVDGNPQSAGDADFELIDIDLLMKQLREAQNRLNMVVLDACRSNPFSGRGLRATGSGLAEIKDRPSGTIISYATAPGKVARDGSPGDHSPYTAALIDAIGQPGLDVFQVFNRVAVSVKNATRGEQEPWVSSSAIEGQFFFVPPAPAAPPPLSAPAAPAAPATVADAELLFWQAIVNSSNPADFEDYLAHYPDGRFASLARRRAVAPAEAQASAQPDERVALAVPAPAATPRAASEPVLAPGAAVELGLALKLGERQSLQRWLTALGFDTRGSDGQIGPQTRRAISAYQKAKGVPETGYFDADVVQALSSEGPAAQAKAEAARNALSAAAPSAGAARGAPAQQALATPAPRDVRPPVSSAEIATLLARANTLAEAKQYGEALALYREAAEHGDAVGATNVALYYRNGWGVAQDYGQAMQWYRKAADQGYALAKNGIGLMYEYGWGVPKDPPQAVSWFRQAAELGYAASQNNLGNAYRRGWGTAKDYGEAMRWYRKASDQGYAQAKFHIGYLYEAGLGVPQDYGQAYQWYRQAADQNNADALNAVGTCYRLGWGVTRDYAEAMRWYGKAIERGNARAHNNIGIMQENGHGVARDYAQALQSYRRAAEKGDTRGATNLGRFYETGRAVERDYRLAMEWYRKAADQGYDVAQRAVGLLYVNGWGVTKDVGQARQWLTLAAEQGDKTASQWLEKLR